MTPAPDACSFGAAGGKVSLGVTQIGRGSLSINAVPTAATLRTTKHSLLCRRRAPLVRRRVERLGVQRHRRGRRETDGDGIRFAEAAAHGGHRRRVAGGRRRRPRRRRRRLVVERRRPSRCGGGRAAPARAGAGGHARHLDSPTRCTTWSRRRRPRPGHQTRGGGPARAAAAARRAAGGPSRDGGGSPARLRLLRRPRAGALT